MMNRTYGKRPKAPSRNCALCGTPMTVHYDTRYFSIETEDKDPKPIAHFRYYTGGYRYGYNGRICTSTCAVRTITRKLGGALWDEGTASKTPTPEAIADFVANLFNGKEYVRPGASPASIEQLALKQIGVTK